MHGFYPTCPKCDMTLPSGRDDFMQCPMARITGKCDYRGYSCNCPKCGARCDADNQNKKTIYDDPINNGCALFIISLLFGFLGPIIWKLTRSGEKMPISAVIGSIIGGCIHIIGFIVLLVAVILPQVFDINLFMELRSLIL